MMGTDLQHLRSAARLALRGHGGAEPNPMVGCVIVSPRGETVGWGYHRRVGGPHAEVVALGRAGDRARGATLYCTLEPCNHTGRTGPCTEAIIRAGCVRVVIARRDPNPVAAGGIDKLRQSGIAVEVNDRCAEAVMVADPFAHRVRSGLPWVTVKWAQTLDGKIATRTGESQWISCKASRRIVHQERGRVDAILTGIGTVLKDDPTLTAREVRVRRIARRIVIDPRLQTPLDCKLVKSIDIAPLTIVCRADDSQSERAKSLRERGAEVVGIPSSTDELPLAPALRGLVQRFDATHVLVEAGSGVMSRLFQQKLVNDVWVFSAPLLLGDDAAAPAVTGMVANHLTDGVKMRLLATRKRGGDVIARYRVER